MAKKKPRAPSSTIARNKRATYDYTLTDRFEAGLVLQGWEVKSIRAAKCQLTESYVLLKDGEAYLFGAHIDPLLSASSHVIADPIRTRKLLLHKQEIARLFRATQQKGYTCVATAMYWKGHQVKVEIALGKGKQEHDKRASEKDKDWAREKGRALRHSADG